MCEGFRSSAFKVDPIELLDMLLEGYQYLGPFTVLCCEYSIEMEILEKICEILIQNKDTNILVFNLCLMLRNL